MSTHARVETGNRTRGKRHVKIPGSNMKSTVFSHPRKQPAYSSRPRASTSDLNQPAGKALKEDPENDPTASRWTQCGATRRASAADSHSVHISSNTLSQQPWDSFSDLSGREPVPATDTFRKDLATAIPLGRKTTSFAISTEHLGPVRYRFL